MRTILILALVVLFALGGCTGEPEPEGDGRLQVVASFYPLAEAARQVGGERVDVQDLTPPGVEPHDLELATDQVDALLDADLVLTIRGFQPAVDEVIAPRNDPPNPSVFALVEDDGDPHLWLDPVVWSEFVRGLGRRLANLDPAQGRSFLQAAGAYADRLDALDEEYRTRLDDCERDLIVTAHDAFGHLADRYGLRVEAITGISPEAEPNPARLDELAHLVEDEGVTTIFTEELVSPEVAETLAREAGVTTAVLSPIESLTQRQIDAGEDYVSLMQANLDTLAGALGCR